VIGENLGRTRSITFIGRASTDGVKKKIQKKDPVKKAGLKKVVLTFKEKQQKEDKEEFKEE
jgi:hypothetical protein